MFHGIDIITTALSFGVWGYAIAFIIAFSESLALVGAFIPGTILIVIFGFLSAHGNLDVWILIIVSAFGAILGDSTSYFLGTKGTHLFKKENRILNISHLEKGTQFFARYGDKSIFVGRFIGVLRPIVPFIAGASRMKMRTFLFWNVISGISWSVAYIFLGYFFGDSFSSIEIWTGRVGVFVVLLALVIFILWYVIKQSAPFWHLFFSYIRSVWMTIRTHRHTRAFVRKYPLPVRFLRNRFRKNSFFGLPLTVLSILFIGALYMLVGVLQDILAFDPIVFVDVRLAHLLFMFRDTGLIHFFLAITALGTFPIVIIVLIGASAIGLLWNKRRYVEALWITVIGSQLFVLLGKYFVHRIRPEGLISVYYEPSFSFPSGHAAIAVALYGFITYMLWQHMHSFRKKTTVLFIGVTLIFLLGFSRLYLGVHFLSDVIGGYLDGIMWLVVGAAIVLWRKYTLRENPSPVSRHALHITGAVAGAVLIISGIYSFSYTSSITQLPQRTDITKTRTVSVGNLFSGLLALPIFTKGIVGASHVPINLIIVAPNSIALKSAFTKAGWYRADPVTIQVLYHSAVAALFNQEYLHAPVSPFFWDEKVNNINFEKPTSIHSIRERHHVRVWDTGTVTPAGEHIYVATISLDTGLKWLVVHRINPNIDAQRDYLATEFKRAGVIENEKYLTLSKPITGRNITGDPFFSDGRAYVLYVR
ncbi:MAG TPA: phosphatase PAP2 family protein [Candidatus Kaiserbacteria bacterium]|nr:phosphatase PAP2 family protein [Candidatus Kaiserbacteria bacterium]